MILYVLAIDFPTVTCSGRLPRADATGQTVIGIFWLRPWRHRLAMRDSRAQAGLIALIRFREPHSSRPFLPACRNQALRRNDRRIAPEICTDRKSTRLNSSH